MTRALLALGGAAIVAWALNPRQAVPMPHSQPGPEPDSREHARDLLRAHNKTVTQVVRVETDHVLYLGGAQSAMTAWLYQQDGQTRVFTEPGFPAYPTVSLPHTPPAPPKAATEAEPPDPSLYAD